MIVNVENLGRVLKRANNKDWDNGVPVITMRLRIAINSLKAQCTKFWEAPPEQVIELIEQENNKKVLSILQENSENAIAFAIRTTRMV